MLLNELTEEQREAVTYDGNILLTACPGSGKTRVIVNKVAHTLAKSEKKVLALTFTVRAAEEMKKRLEKMQVKTDRVWAGTLHAFCLEWIIKSYSGELKELSNGFKIAEEAFCEKILEKLKEEHRINKYESINLKFDRFGRPLEQNAKLKNLLKDYHKALREQNLIDFDLLLFYAYRILESKNIAEKIASQFSLISVDEYQDTQDLQYAIIARLVKTKKDDLKVFFVGDVDQAIYKSLGGIAKTHSEIRSELGGISLRALNLSTNYRSSQRIVDYYSNFKVAKGVPLHTRIKAGGKHAKEIGLISFDRGIPYTALAERIASLIKISLNKSIPANEICVLVPQWWMITSLSKQLQKHLNGYRFTSSLNNEEHNALAEEIKSKSILVNTVMGVKGEEFTTVIAYGLLRGYLPHWSSIINGDELEASSNLLYVLASRAKLNLHLIAEQGRITGNGKAYEVNQELDEIIFNYDLL